MSLPAARRNRENHLGGVSPITLYHSAHALSIAQEAFLTERVGRGDHRAREELVIGNFRLVLAVARSFRGRGLGLADLLQEGTVGLIAAADRFDCTRAFRFSTYAYW